jgi:hypothetical protein
MSKKPQQFVFHAYTPTKRRFKPVIDENSVVETPDANISIVAPILDSQDDQYSEWNDISDAEDMFKGLFSRCTHSNLLRDEDAELSSSSAHYFDAPEYQLSDHEIECSFDTEKDEEDDVNLSDSSEIHPSVDYDFDFTTNSDTVFPFINEGPRKRGRKVQSTFPFPSQGELTHPFESWIIDQAAMNEYMPNYAKQEGFAVNSLKERGGVVRWRCIHGGKYNGHRRLPVEVTEKKHLQNAQNAGISLLLF